MRAAQALGEIKDPKALEPLIAAMHDDNPQVRIDVLHALWQIGDRKAVPAAIDMLKDPNTTVRQGAVQALTQLTRQNFGEDAAKWQAWWEGQAK
jgi:HEAT repeat protein